MGWTVGLFITKGGGRHAGAMGSIKKFIVIGLYRHVRNPMITGVLFFQTAEAIFLHSWPLFLWMVFFFTLNTAYLAWSEEPGLEKRFGETYLDYERHVPRWLPKFKPYRRKAGK